MADVDKPDTTEDAAIMQRMEKVVSEEVAPPAPPKEPREVKPEPAKRDVQLGPQKNQRDADAETLERLEAIEYEQPATTDERQYYDDPEDMPPAQPPMAPPQPPPTPHAQVMQAKAELRAAANQIDWEHLRNTNEGLWAQKWQEFKTLEQNIAQHEANLNDAAYRQQHAAQLQQQHAIANHVEKEEASLLAQIPSWQNPTTRTKEVGELRAFLAAKGFSEEEMNNAYDSKTVVMAYDAMKNAQPKRKRSRAKRGGTDVDAEIKSRNLNPNGMAAADVRLAALYESQGRS